MEKIFVILVTLFTMSACQATSAESEVVVPRTNLSEYQTAYFAGGCFWCVEAIFESVIGVVEVESGYAGGTMKDPTYSLVSSGKTDHAEAVKIYYDSTIIGFEQLVEVFFNSHDPTTLNRQGPDVGKQYRSIAFYQTNQEKVIIDNTIRQLLATGTFSNITTIVQPIEEFYLAENYHQDYERNHPTNPYIRSVSIPRLNAFKQKFPDLLK